MPELIVAMDKNCGIGYQGMLPWYNKDELALFREKTLDKTVILGRKTIENLPELSGRKVVCLSRNNDSVGMFLKKWSNIPEIINDIREINKFTEKSCIIAGGKQLYDQTLSIPGYITKIHISIMDNAYVCDTYFNRLWLYDYIICEESKGNDFTHYVLEYSPHGEGQYLNILYKLVDHDKWRKSRNAMTCSMFKNDMTFDLRNGFPLLTTKKMFLRGVIEELIFFINGKTNTKELEEKGVNIWKGNTSQKFLDSRNLPYAEGVIGPCFIEGTKVLTDSGYKNIECVIENNDKLYTHTGKWKPIIERFCKPYSDSLIKIKVYYNRKIIVTPEHPFYVKSFIKDIDDEKRVVPIYSEPEWVQAKDLTNRCVIGMKIETKQNIPKFDQIILNTEEQWFMVGFFLGNGLIETDEDYNEKICFIINEKKRDLIVDKIYRVLDIQLCDRYKDCFKYICHNKIYTNILKTFGNYDLDKIIPDWVHKAPNCNIKWFLNGYCMSDACLEKSINFKRYTTISSDIAYSIQRLYLKLGIFAIISMKKKSFYNKIFGDKESYLNDVYYIEVNENKVKQCKYSHIEDNYAWFNVSFIDEIFSSRTIQVYNFDVEDDHSYTVENLAVHNCYGYQWRYFNAPYYLTSKGTTATPNGGIDQLANMINLIKNDPNSRRILMTSFNPSQAELGVLYPCFMENTRVLTNNGYKLIQNVSLTDQLFTHTGKFQSINNIQTTQYNKGNIYEINIYHHPSIIKTTPEHPFYVKEVKFIKKNCKTVDIETSEPKWIQAQNLRSEHYVGMQINKNNITPSFRFTKNDDKYNTNIIEKVLDNELEWFLFGYFIGDSWVEYNKKNVFNLVFNTQDEEIIINILSKLNITYSYKKYELESKYKTVICTNFELWHIFKDFGDLADNKRIPEWVQDSPSNYINRFIDGYTKALGCYTKNKELKYTTMAVSLALGLQRLYLKIGKILSVCYQNRNPMCVNEKETYLCYLKQSKNISSFCIIEKDYIWYKIRNIDICFYDNPITVYNFDVKEDHTYCVDNLIVHNCHSITIQFYVEDEYLDMFCYNRSQDFILGTPFNIASSSLFLMLVAKLTDKTPRFFHMTLGDTHIYEQHLDGAREILKRIPYKFPTLKIPDIKNLGDLCGMKVEEFILSEYCFHPVVKVPMIA